MSNENSQKTNTDNLKGKGSLIGTMATFAWYLLILFCVISVINTAFGLKLEFNNTALPRHWDETIGLIGVTVIWGIFWALLTFVPPIRRFGQRNPWWTSLIILGIIAAAIVVITIIDNDYRAKRRAHWDAIEQAKQDSILKLDADTLY